MGATITLSKDPRRPMGRFTSDGPDDFSLVCNEVASKVYALVIFL